MKRNSLSVFKDYSIPCSPYINGANITLIEVETFPYTNDVSNSAFINCGSNGTKKIDLIFNSGKSRYTLFVEVKDTFPTQSFKPSCPSIIYNPIDVVDNTI
jgi:hypothetical protein